MMKDLYENSYLNSANAAFVEARYAEYLRDPTAVSEDWQAFFARMPTADEPVVQVPDQAAIRDEFARLARQPRHVVASETAPPAGTADATCVDAKQVAVLS